MIYRVSEGNHSQAGHSASKTARSHGTISPNELLLELCFPTGIAYARNDMIISVVM